MLSNSIITVSIFRRVISSSKLSYIQLLVLALQIETIAVFVDDYAHSEVQFTPMFKKKRKSKNENFA